MCIVTLATAFHATRSVIFSPIGRIFPSIDIYLYENLHSLFVKSPKMLHSSSTPNALSVMSPLCRHTYQQISTSRCGNYGESISIAVANHASYFGFCCTRALSTKVSDFGVSLSVPSFQPRCLCSHFDVLHLQR